MAVRIASRASSSTKSPSTKSSQNARKSSKSSKTSSKNTRTAVQTAKKTSTSTKAAAKTAAQKATDIAREKAMAAKKAAQKADEKAREAAMRTKKTAANSQSPIAASTKASAGIAVKSSPATVPSKTAVLVGIGAMVGVRYLTDAPKIYTASGHASSYNTLGKSGTSQGANAPNKMPAVPSIGVSSFTYGRPEESYRSQKSTKPTGVKKVPLPVAEQKPVKVKSKTGAGKTSGIRKVSLPSDSRSGAGKTVYSKKTNRTGIREGASFVTSFIPVVGDAKDIQETVTGKDLITGKKLGKADRILTAGAIVLPIVSGTSVRAVKSGAKAVKKPAKKVVKAAFKKGKKTAGKAGKDLGQKAGTRTAAGKVKDTGKRVADGFHEAGKKISKTVKENGKIELDHGNGVRKGKGGSKTIDYISLSENLGKKVEMEGYKIIDIEDAVQANKDWADMGYNLPPVAENTKVYNVEAGNFEYARVFKNGVNKPKSPFILRADDIKGLSASEIAEKYALPQIPDSVVYPHIPSDTPLEISIVGPQESWGTIGGDAQYAIKDALLDDDWFTDIHPLD